MRRPARLALVVCLLATACAEPFDEDAPIGDDSELGDSLPPGGKDDGFGVPDSLGLDKRGILYLTFDDGPSPRLTPRILDVLARHGAKATFFVNGANVAGGKAILARAAREGHIIANHQWAHQVATTAQFRPWVTRTREAIREAAGAMPLYFRYPFGAMTAAKEAILREEGYRDGGIGWDIDTLDWDFGSDGRASRSEVPSSLRSDFEGFVVAQAVRRGGGVVLMHDVQSITAARLDSLLTQLEARGFRYGQLPIERTGTPPPPPAGGFIGDPCAGDGDCRFDGAFCLKEATTPQGYCTRTCSTSCPDRAGYPVTRCVRAPDGYGADVDVCAIGCGSGRACREGYQCQTLRSPGGTSREVCWGS